MKITVKKGENLIIVDESDNTSGDKRTSLRWEDQAETVHKTIKVMVQSIKEI